MSNFDEALLNVNGAGDYGLNEACFPGREGSFSPYEIAWIEEKQDYHGALVAMTVASFKSGSATTALSLNDAFALDFQQLSDPYKAEYLDRAVANLSVRGFVQRTDDGKGIIPTTKLLAALETGEYRERLQAIVDRPLAETWFRKAS